MTPDRWFDRLASASEPSDIEDRAPARLKSKIYSAMIARLAGSGPLQDLARTKAGGHRLCVFENALTMVPLGQDARTSNPCRVCHARVLGERMEHAPIFWPGCPYSEFHNG